MTRNKDRIIIVLLTRAKFAVNFCKYIARQAQIFAGLHGIIRYLAGLIYFPFSFFLLHFILLSQGQNAEVCDATEVE